MREDSFKLEYEQEQEDDLNLEKEEDRTKEAEIRKRESDKECPDEDKEMPPEQEIPDRSVLTTISEESTASLLPVCKEIKVPLSLGDRATIDNQVSAEAGSPAVDNTTLLEDNQIEKVVHFEDGRKRDIMVTKPYGYNEKEEPECQEDDSCQEDIK